MSLDKLTPEYVHVPRLAAGSKESVDYLESEGYVVIAGALSPSEAEHALDLTWDYLKELGTGVDRNDVDTWGDDQWPVNVHGGIVPSQGIGHSAAQWYIRSVPAVKDAFAAVWDDEDLLVSFDGMALWRPTDVDPTWATDRGGAWLHIDQHPISRPGRQCIQAAVTLTATSPEIGGNIVVPGSHKWFADIPTRYTDRLAAIPEDQDHFRFPTDDPQLKESPPIMAHMEAGDMMLWDSRTVHCSSPGTGAPVTDRSAPKLLRAASLVCMMPRAHSNEEVMAMRRAAVANRISTTNWSDRWINADEFPMVLEAGDPTKYKLPPVPQLDEQQRAMVG